MAWRLALLDGVDVDASTTDRGRVDGVVDASTTMREKAAPTPSTRRIENTQASTSAAPSCSTTAL